MNSSEINNDITISTSVDRFGIEKLYPTIVGGREWFSNWNNGHARSWNDNQNDPDDPEFWTKDKGTGSWKTDGLGILKISGSGPRMYVIDTARVENWHNVEVTVYGERISDSSISFAGIMAYARTNHFVDADICDDRGYGGRFTYDGRVDFEKETAHHLSNGNAQTATKRPWGSGGMPKNVWIGYKYVVYDLPDGNVKLELYMDTTDGLNGGTWTKITEFTDNGNNFGVNNGSCKSGINPGLRLTNSDIRPGSETGKPNLSVYFRSDGVGTDGLWYKKASIREITPSAPVVNKFDVFVVGDQNNPSGALAVSNIEGAYTADEACQQICNILNSI